MRSLLSIILLVPCLASAGCAASREPGPPALSPGAARLIPDGPLSLGIRYGKIGVLGLRRVDSAGHPVAGAEVRFDTADAQGGGAQGGSTLSVPRAITDANGHVEVSIAAGTEEVSFGVTASSAGTEDLHYYVSVSRFNFVTLAAQVAYTGEAMGTVARVEASVYQGTACDRLAPSRALPPPLPLGVKDADGSSAVLEFPDLLDRDHALLGRALDDKGRIVASGCVDLSAGQVLPGETVAVPVPLVLTSVNLDGSFRLKLHAAFSPVPPAVAQPTAAWDTLTACPSGAAQPLLDRLVIALGADPLAVEIQRRRGPPDLHGCRPAQRTEGGQIVATLDEALHALLYLKDSPAQLLPDIVATLDALAGAVDVEGSMDFALVAANQYTATHRLGQVGFAVGERAVNYDLAALGLPLLVAEGVAVSVQGQRVSIGPHGFTLRVGALWQRAFEEIEAALLPSGPSIEPEALLSAVLGAATRPGPPMNPPLHGCLAVEDLLCQAIGANACSLAPACATAASAQAEAMRAPFSPVLGIDFTLSGGGMATDSKGAAHADQIESGVFDVAARVGAPVVPLGAQAAFRAARLE